MVENYKFSYYYIDWIDFCY